MLRILFLLVTINCITQKMERMPLLHIAPEVMYLYDDNIENKDDIEASDFEPRDSDFVQALGVNVGFNVSEYLSIGAFVSTEKVLSRDLDYNGWAIAANFGTEPQKNGWAASMKLGSHFGNNLREGGFLGRLGLGFKFYLFKLLNAQTEFIYSYQALKFKEIVDVESRQNLTINGIGLSMKIYL
jgi:hypothetical protein